jgi:hypothetical protein
MRVSAKTMARRNLDVNAVARLIRIAEDVLRAAAHVLGLARASEILDAEQRRAHAADLVF